MPLNVIGEIQDTEKKMHQVNVMLSDDQHKRFKEILDECAPNMREGQLMRLAWTYFEHKATTQGLIAIMADILVA